MIGCCIDNFALWLCLQNLTKYLYFLSGDGRASEQPGLTAIHTIFLREHNRIVEGLRGVNPHWDADQLFEHARRIVAATFTHIIYNEFLPRLLSWNAVNLYGLKLLPSGNLVFVDNLQYLLSRLLERQYLHWQLLHSVNTSYIPLIPSKNIRYYVP